MSDFVENGVTKVRETFAGMNNVDPADIARVVLEYIEANPPPSKAADSAAKGNT